jgi:hypothetical protein
VFCKRNFLPLLELGTPSHPKQQKQYSAHEVKKARKPRVIPIPETKCKIKTNFLSWQMKYQM